jgi:hypothetical protein
MELTNITRIEKQTFKIKDEVYLRIETKNLNCENKQISKIIDWQKVKKENIEKLSQSAESILEKFYIEKF